MPQRELDKSELSTNFFEIPSKASPVMSLGLKRAVSLPSMQENQALPTPCGGSRGPAGPDSTDKYAYAAPAGPLHQELPKVSLC